MRHAGLALALPAGLLTLPVVLPARAKLATARCQQGVAGIAPAGKTTGSVSKPAGSANAARVTHQVLVRSLPRTRPRRPASPRCAVCGHENRWSNPFGGCRAVHGSPEEPPVGKTSKFLRFQMIANSKRICDWNGDGIRSPLHEILIPHPGPFHPSPPLSQPRSQQEQTAQAVSRPAHPARRFRQVSGVPHVIIRPYLLCSRRKL